MLHLQAGLLLPATLPRFATEAIAAGHGGETLYAMAELLGESQAKVLAAAEAIPEIEEQLVSELRLPRRSREDAVAELAQLIAAETIAGDLNPEDGAGELVTLALAADDDELIRTTSRLYGILDEWEHIPATERERQVLEQMLMFSRRQP